MLSPQLDLYKSIATHIYNSIEGEPMNTKVLEIGFGTGFGTNQFVKTGADVMAIEKDWDAVHFAGECLPGTTWLCKDIVADIKWLSYFAPFNAVVMVEVLEHIEDWKLALTNVASLLHPGGKLYISARNATADLRRNEIHEREWTAREFSAALGSVFSDVKLYDYTLENEVGLDTRVTPLIAMATK